jgi:hypothetical protein
MILFCFRKTPTFGSARSTDKLHSMSPAARQLATNKLGIKIGGMDRALKASYTPQRRYVLCGNFIFIFNKYSFLQFYTISIADWCISITTSTKYKCFIIDNTDKK